MSKPATSSLCVGDDVQYAKEGGHPITKSTIRAIDSTRSMIVLTDNTVLNSTDRVILRKGQIYLQVDEYNLESKTNSPPASKMIRLDLSPSLKKKPEPKSPPAPKETRLDSPPTQP